MRKFPDYRISRRNIIFLLLLSATILIISTYAWFSNQKNVTLANLTGTVEVVEGLEISLDAMNWSQEVNFADYTPDQLKNVVYAVTETTSDDKVHNIIPSELLPVSTTGYEAVGKKEITMIRGINTNSILLDSIKATSLTKDNGKGGTVATTPGADADIYPGYYAIDFFLKNTSAVNEGTDVLQLNEGSSVSVATFGDATVGLQNTPRVAFALYKNATTTSVMSEYAEVVANTMDSEISDVAIWEPNAYEHVDYIVRNNNKITWLDTDKVGYLGTDGQRTGLFTTDEKIPTYALKESAIGATITDIYNWTGNKSEKVFTDSSGNIITEVGYDKLQKQVTLQTDKTNAQDFTIAGGFKDLISADQSAVEDYEKAFYNNNPSTIELNKFEIPKNQISRLRMYIWLEGQDVDCINYASHGGGIEIDVGLVKDAEKINAD